MKDISKCVNFISNFSVDTSAYFRGLSELKGIDFAKHRRNVQEDMRDNPNK